MSYGLPRKIRIAFTLQALLVSLALLIGGYLVVVVVKHTFVVSILQEEAGYYWAAHKADPAAPVPDTKHIRGYLQPIGAAETALPPALRGLDAGFTELEAADALVWVDDTQAGRLYLTFKRSHAGRMAFWFGVIPVALVLLSIYGVSWLTYRISRRLVSPVSWLAQRISGWDPRRPDADDLAPARLPRNVQGEVRQLAVALYQMANRVHEHVAREQNFTRDASHALRTPLTVIRVATDVALADTAGISARHQRSLMRIQRAGKDMEAVIEAFLILARENDIQPVAERVDVVEVARAEVAALAESSEGKPLPVTVLVNAPCELWAPARVLHVILANLLQNAHAATDEGGIEVVIDAQALTVRDTGVGMDEDAVQRAFEPFYRVGGETHLAKGAGLGLSVVKRLCDRFGWQVSLESRPDEGTSVMVRFSAP